MTSIAVARAAIAQRALDEIGTPFRLFGRTAGKALDCVGLALVALAPHLPSGVLAPRYSMRGDYAARARDFLAHSVLTEMETIEPACVGDLVLASLGPTQLHFLICTASGWVHADAGLGRVVLRPGALEWLVRGVWRLNGI
jgi:murein DD-endopeptidase / murein LD-carboxypeptidase